MGEEFESLAGQLLVAVPGMTDPNFARTVVLMIDHTPEGAVGMVLNRAYAGGSAGSSSGVVVGGGQPSRGVRRWAGGGRRGDRSG